MCVQLTRDLFAIAKFLLNLLASVVHYLEPLKSYKASKLMMLKN